MEKSKTPLSFPGDSFDDIDQSVKKDDFRYRNLVEMCTDLIWAVDIQGRWTFLNRQATQMIYGYEPEEMLGKSFTDFEPSEKIKSDLEVFEKVKSGVPYFKHETIHLRKDGQEVHLSFNAIVRKNQKGEVIGTFGTATDITEQKQIQKFLQEKSELLLRQQNSLYQLSKMDLSHFDSALRNILATSADFMNLERVSCWLFNKERSEIICQDLYTRSTQKHESGAYLKAENFPRYFKALEDNLLLACQDARNDPRTSEFTENYLVPQNIYSMMDVPIRISGKIIGVLCHEHTKKPHFWREEEQDFGTSASSMISIAYVISQLKQAEQALQKKTHELERSNKALEEFAYIASHDLQEPLYIITSFVDTIRTQHKKNLDPKVSSLIERIYNAGFRMTHLISDLLNFAKISTLKKPFEALDLNEIVKNVWKDLELRAKEAQAEFKMQTLPLIYSDKLQMTQLFLNLLSNALKFKKANSKVEIEVKSKLLDDDWVEIRVEDKGIGFEEEYAQKIFKPFQRLHSRSQYSGSGMGLAVCQKIIERHQGKIEAFSKEGEGSQFVFTLPLKPL